MKITSISIRNFRSIHSLTLKGPANDIWTLVGQNSAGKSAAMLSIRGFYGDYSITAEDFNRQYPKEPIEITIEYKLSDDEFTDLPAHYRLADNRLVVVKRFTKNDLKGEGHGFETRDGSEIERPEEFFGAKNVQMGKLGRVVYVPAIKDLADELKSTKSAIFSKLLVRIVSEKLADLDSYKKLIEQAEAFARELKSPTKSASQEFRSVSELEGELDSSLKSWGLRANLELAPPSPSDLIMGGSRLLFSNLRTGHEEDPLRLGSGAQRAIVNSMLILWAKVDSLKTKADKKLFRSDLTILLYEEPESLLHYDQEKNLLRNLEQLAASDSTQVLISTHSPNLISTKHDALKCITRFVLDGSGQSITFSPAASYLAQLDANRDEFDFVLWLNADRNTMFFVDRVILVEGATDKAFLNYIIQTKSLAENIYIVDCGGKDRIPHFMNLCSQFGIKHSVMFDRDGDKNPEHKARNKAVEDSRSSFTKALKDFVDDLESHVGFPAVARDRDKPVEILSQLKAGKLAPRFEEEFIAFLKQ